MEEAKIKQKEGGILGGSGHNNNIKLSIQLEPWGVIRASFRIEKNAKHEWQISWPRILKIMGV